MPISAFDLLSSDLDWREAELGSLRLLLSRKDVSDHQKKVLLRAAWALLYAHYEGFCKTALTIFFDNASRSARTCGVLPENTRLFALKEKIKSIRQLPEREFLLEIENFKDSHHGEVASFPDVETKSNLWADVLRDLVTLADIELPALDVHSTKLNTLVSRRNKIAHGENDIINEVEYYRGFELAVYDVLYELAYGIGERLERSPYRI